MTRQAIFLSVLAFLSAAASEESCSRPADIIFLLDDSRSIWYVRFNDELTFVKNLVGKFDIGQDTTRIAAATFSTGVREEFSLGSYNTVTEVQEAVSKIRQRNGTTTDTHKAIQFAREVLFKQARPGVPHILIIITDGVSHNRTETRRQAQETIKSGVAIIIIGVGGIDRTRLAEMASLPTEKYLFTVSSFPALSMIDSLVAVQACEAQADQPPLEKECHGKPAEVVFVLDKSSSVYMLDFQKQLTFVTDVIDTFDIGPGRTRVAAVSFSTNATIEYNLDEFLDKKSIKDRTAKIAYTGGVTETRLALQVVRDQVLTSHHGLRPDIPHVVIVITDGHSQDYMETKSVADSLKQAGVHMFAIGVGNRVDPQELNAIGSTPVEKYVFTVESYRALNTLKNIITHSTCQESQ